MKQTEPDFWVVEYATTTLDPRTDLVIAIGGTEEAADILQRTGGFLSAAEPRPPGGVGPGGTYMANLADEYGTDVEIHIKALTTTIHADTPTGAPPGCTTCWNSSAWNATNTPREDRSTSGTRCPNTSVRTSRSTWRPAPSPPCSWPGTKSTARLMSSTKPPTGRPCATSALVRPALPRSIRHRPALPHGPHRLTTPRKPPGGPGIAPGPPTQPPQLPENPVASRTRPQISNRLKPRLATALFRRYLRACIPTGPDRTSPLAGARPEGALAETQRVGQRHHH
ncbi:hypothetical protein [Streptomyces sp. NPDC026589]|uniref:hypothetical protein n=1 Tax=Streptomyces sp. NPDC026589 TaxID=3155609 RepID=UPI0033DBBCE9